MKKVQIALEHNGFEAVILQTEAEALELVRREITQRLPATVSFGDSLSAAACGIFDWLRAENGKNGLTLLDGFDTAMPRPERLRIRRQALLCDLFVTGVNAISEDGRLFWLDMVGNRIAPVSFGPEKVFIIAGRNKIVPDREAARERIRTVAAPANAIRHTDFRTPCRKTGHCHDCNSPDRICNAWLELVRCHPRKRICVLLIDKDLGF